MNNLTITAKPGSSIMTQEREFDAPREKLFAALTQKDKLEKWWIGPGYSVDIVKLDPQAGGTWKFVQTNKSGQTFTFFGSFHEVSIDRIIQTIDMLDMPPGHAALERMELIDLGNGRTKLFITAAFLSEEDRDGMIQSGMEEGAKNTYDALEAVLKGMK